MTKYEIHHDFKKFENIKPILSPIFLPFINFITLLGFNKTAVHPDIVETKMTIPGYRYRTIDVITYKPKNIEPGAPCLVYFHGGAFALKAAPAHKTLLCEYSIKTPCKVVFVDYRLAPKHPFPIGVEDCYAAVEWVYKSAELLGIDRNHIAVGGDSAGGALAAGVCLMARERKAPRICFQMLIYPVTDARQNTRSIKEYIDTPIWNSKLNEKMWQMYLKNEFKCPREYASPAEASNLENLPDAYVEVAEYDCLRDEGINYAKALYKSGSEVELNLTKGAVHGFDIALKSEVVRKCIIKRTDALRKAFYSETI